MLTHIENSYYESGYNSIEFLGLTWISLKDLVVSGWRILSVSVFEPGNQMG